jgi:hypothetical protein
MRYPKNCEDKVNPQRMEQPKLIANCTRMTNNGSCKKIASIMLLIVLFAFCFLFYFGSNSRQSDVIAKFNENVRAWENNVRSKYIKTAFSPEPILNNTYSGYWVAFEGEAAERLFLDPLLLHKNPKSLLNHSLNELEWIFEKFHIIRMNASSTTDLRQACQRFGIFMPIFKVGVPFKIGSIDQQKNENKFTNEEFLREQHSVFSLKISGR